MILSERLGDLDVRFLRRGNGRTRGDVWDIYLHGLSYIKTP